MVSLLICLSESISYSYIKNTFDNCRRFITTFKYLYLFSCYPYLFILVVYPTYSVYFKRLVSVLSVYIHPLFLTYCIRLIKLVHSTSIYLLILFLCLWLYFCISRISDNSFRMTCWSILQRTGCIIFMR
jgi:hypothetical protein